MLPGARAGEPTIVAVGLGKPDDVDHRRSASRLGRSHRADAGTRRTVATWLAQAAAATSTQRRCAALSPKAPGSPRTPTTRTARSPSPVALRTLHRDRRGRRPELRSRRASARRPAQSTGARPRQRPPDEVTPTHLAELASEVADAARAAGHACGTRDAIEAEQASAASSGVAAGIDEPPATSSCATPR